MKLSDKKTLLYILILISFLGFSQQKSFEGIVLNKESYYQEGNILTRNTIKVTNKLRGVIEDTLEVITKGGVIGLNAEYVSHSIQLKIGKTYSLTLNNNKLDRQEYINKNRALRSRSNSFSFFPTAVSAGTQDAITITGTGFGNETGRVRFRNSDFGGALLDDVLPSQILSWTDTQIKVEVPDFAGNGDIRVTTSNGIDFNSSEDLEVTFSVINLNFNLGNGNIAYPTQHIDNNNEGGYTFQFNENFIEENREGFNNSFEQWRCQTGINWKIGSDTSINTISGDGVNVILFTETSAGILGTATSRFQGCANNEGGIDWYVNEVDIIFNSNINWNFTQQNATTSQIDFESVAIHELGHAHQLGHVIDESRIMHFSLGGGDTNRFLQEVDLEGANYVQTLSTSNQVCGQNLLTSFECTLSLTDTENQLITIYPNPTKGILEINTVLYDKITLYDIQGKIINTFINQSTLDVKELSPGLYFLRIESNGRNMIKKIVKQ